MKKMKKILKLFRLTGTLFILEYIDTHKETQYKDLNKVLAVYTLNARLRDLLNQKLIEHHFERKDKRKEWYEMTEKGKRILQHIRKLRDI